MKKRLTIFLCLFILAWTSQGEAFQSDRDAMVERQLIARGIRNPLVLDAMRTVQRHRLVPQERRSSAYGDFPLPIGYGQTISQPYIVALMTELLDPQPNFRTLEIGAGSGYQAAVLAEIVDEVYTVEIVPELAQRARRDLQGLGYENIFVKEADGYYGWAEHAPFDAIIVTAAAEFIPPPLIEQLKVGGVMCIPVGSPFSIQTLYVITKIDDDNIQTRAISQVRFVPFTRENQ